MAVGGVDGHSSYVVDGHALLVVAVLMAIYGQAGRVDAAAAAAAAAALPACHPLVLERRNGAVKRRLGELLDLEALQLLFCEGFGFFHLHGPILWGARAANHWFS